MSNASDKRMLGGRVDKGVRERRKGSVGIVVELLERQAGRQKDRQTERATGSLSVSATTFAAL